MENSTLMARWRGCFSEKSVLALTAYLPLLLAGIIPLASSKIFFESYMTPKWLVIYGSSILAFGFIFFRGKQLLLPSFSPLQRFFFLILVSILGINLFIHDGSFLSSSILNRFSYILIVLYAYALFVDKRLTPLNAVRLISIPFIGSASILYVMVAGQLVMCFFSFKNFDPTFFTNATFGNPNMLAEFLGFTLVLALFTFSSSGKMFSNYFQISFIFLTLVYILFLGCRSVILATCVSVIYFFVSLRVDTKRFPKHIFLFFLIPLTFVLLPKQYSTVLPSAVSMTSASKKDSARERIEIWKGTLKMIRDNPWGVGADKFDYSFIPYKKNTQLPLSEDVIEKSPHFECLRYLAEDGLWATIIGGIFFLLIFYSGLTSTYSNPFLKRFIIGCFIYVVIQSFFQFPLENPIPFFISALLVGLFLARFFAPPQPIPSKPVYFLPLFAVYGFLAGSICLANYLASTASYDVQKMHLAEKLDPTNWHIGLFQIEANLSQGKYDEAIWFAMREVKRRPYNFPALYLLGISQINRGMVKEGCETLRGYDALFNGKSKRHDLIVATCS